MSHPKEYIAHIDRLVEYFQSVTGADEYDIQTAMVTEIPDRPDAAAIMEIDSVYLTAIMSVTDKVLEYWNDESYGFIADLVCHEFCHILTEPLYEAALPAFNRFNSQVLEDLRERQTQRVSNALLRVVPDSVWMPKKGGKK